MVQLFFQWPFQQQDQVMESQLYFFAKEIKKNVSFTKMNSGQ